MLSINGIAPNCTVTFYIDIRFEGFQLHLTPLKEVGWHFRIFQELRDIKKEENILKHDGKSPFLGSFLEDVNRSSSRRVLERKVPTIFCSSVSLVFAFLPVKRQVWKATTGRKWAPHAWLARRNIAKAKELVGLVISGLFRVLRGRAHELGKPRGKLMMRGKFAARNGSWGEICSKKRYTQAKLKGIPEKC